MELRVVQYRERIPIDGEVCTAIIRYPRYKIQYRHLEGNLFGVDCGKWKDVPVVECEEGSEPSED